MYFALVFVALLCLPDQIFAQPIRIGWIGPLTGNSAVLGIDSVEAARMVVEDQNSRGGIGGRPLELIAEDDQYDTAKSVSAYSKLVGQGAAAILISTYGGVFALADSAMRDHVLLIDPLDCNDKIAALSENTFCLATESESIGRIIADDLGRQQISSVAVLYDERNPFMTLVEQVIAARIPGAMSFESGAAGSDLRSILTKLRSRQPKAMVFLGHDPMGAAMRDARALGLGADFYTLGTITSPGYQQLAGDAANGARVAYWEAPRGPRLEQFLTRFSARVKRPPILELATVPTFDAAGVVVSALGSCAAKPQPWDGCLREQLLALKGYPGLSGELSMDRDGAVRSIREAIFEFQHGKLTRVPGASAAK